MKQLKSILLFGNLFFVFVIPTFSQEILPEVVIASMKYKYLSAVDNKEVPQPVRLLEHMAATYDVKSSDFYDDEFDEYAITFYLPKGYLLATYDKDGKLLRTAERYKNVALPNTINQALIKKYPDWSIPKDVYLVTYEDEKGATKLWKVVLRKGDKRQKVKLNANGDFISK